MTDPIADMLTRIRNAITAHKETVEIPASNMKKAIADILLSEGYVKDVKIVEDGYNGKISIVLKYSDKKIGYQRPYAGVQAGTSRVFGRGKYAQGARRTGDGDPLHQQRYPYGQAGKGRQRWRGSPLLYLVIGREQNYVKNR